MLRNILFNISSHLPLRIIGETHEDGRFRPYLERYFLFSAMGFTCYLHRFVGSDPDRGLHDHPWPYAASLIVAGSYIEERDAGTQTVRWFNTLKGTDFHRVILPEGWKTVWTIFIHREKRVKTWGFLNRNGEYKDYEYKQPLIQWWKRAPKGAAEPLRQPAWD